MRASSCETGFRLDYDGYERSMALNTTLGDLLGDLLALHVTRADEK